MHVDVYAMWPCFTGDVTMPDLPTSFSLQLLVVVFVPTLSQVRFVTLDHRRIPPHSWNNNYRDASTLD